MQQMTLDLGQPPQHPPEGNVLSGEGVWQVAPSPEAAVRGADAVLVLTEWQQFTVLDWPALAALMRQPAWLFDARAICDASGARAAGLKVWRVGEG
jgi:UDPglucose 6-dehydrogenase